MQASHERVKMAAGSDLLDDVFFNTEVDEKVVSDLVGSLESELTGSGRGKSSVRVQAAANHIDNSAIGRNSNVQDSEMGLSQELAKPGKIDYWLTLAYSGHVVFLFLSLLATHFDNLLIQLHMFN